MVTSVIRATLGRRAVCLAWINFIILIAGYESQLITTSTTHAEAQATHREQVATRRDTQRMQMTATPDSWVSFGDKDYLFVMDTGRRNDLSRDEAKRRCQELGTGLLSVESDDEMEYIRRQIRQRVKYAGQEFAHEQWWTAGMVHGDLWVWDKEDRSPVTVSALKKKEVPKTAEARYLALSHGHDQQGWRLRGLPGNYRLRYICQREPSLNDSPEKLERQLRHFLIRNGRNARKSTTKAFLSILVDPTRITKLDEEVRQICIMNKFTLEWRDSSVQWNGTRFSNVSSVFVSSGQIWIPQVTMLSGNFRQKLNSLRGAQVLLTSLGIAQVKVVDEMCITCHWSALLFPFDQYRCPVQLESSSNVVTNLQLSPLSPTTIESFTTSNWNLDRYHQSGSANCASDSGTTASRTGTGTGNVTWDCARLEFYFRRSVALYVAVLLLPLLILTMPLLVLLLVSPNSRLKIPSMLILVVLYSVLLHLSCAIVPVKSSQVSIIALYPLSLMIISVSSACVSIVCTRSPRDSTTDRKSLVAFCCGHRRSETRHFRHDSCDSFDESDRGRYKTSASESAAKTGNSRRGRRHQRSLSKSSLPAPKPSLPPPVFDGTNEITYTADKIREQWGVGETPIDAPWATGTLIGERASTDEIHTNEETSTLKSQTHRTPGAPYRTGSSLEKTVDMAFFVVAVALLVGYAVVIVFASF